MTGTRRNLLVALMMTELAGVGRLGVATSGQAVSVRIRAGNAAIATLIQHASERSHTFRGLEETISASDGIVYIEPGTCGRDMRACFVNVTMAGSNRILWLMVDVRGVDCDLMGLIGHELQHAVEVLGDPSITSGTEMYFFYRENPDGRSGGPAFETDAAIKADETVRAEVRRRGRCTESVELFLR
jgi:hypothetical protein